LEREPIEVAAGLVFRQGKLLVTQRKAGSHLAGCWEFPGGKRHAGESFEGCVQRELKEELGITVEVGELIERIHHRYSEKEVDLWFFTCRLPVGEPQSLEGQAVRWISPTEIDDLEFPSADARLLDRLMQESNLWLNG